MSTLRSTVHSPRFPRLLLLLPVLLFATLISAQARAEVNTAYNIDDADGAIQYYGSWTAVNNIPEAIHSTLHWSNAPGSYATASFVGTTLTYFYSMASNRGAFDLYIDNVHRGTFSALAAQTRRQVGRTYSLTTGYHTVKVVVGAGGFVDLDLFAIDIASVGIGTYDDSDPHVRYFGTWNNSTYTPGTYGNTLKVTNTATSGFRFTFVGDEVTYLFSQDSNRGIAAVTIDGQHRTYIDQYNPVMLRQQGVTFSGLGSGTHILNVVNTGQKSALATNTYTDLDAVIVGDVYVRANAKLYADAWAKVYNPAFVYYDDYRGCNDCTNYVSQVLLAGGVPEIEIPNSSYENNYRYWAYLDYWLGSLHNTKTWSATEWFQLYVENAPWRFQRVQAGRREAIGYPTGLLEGDFILMDLDHDDGIQAPTHASVYLGVDVVMEPTEEAGLVRPLRSQHCVNRKRVRWDYNLANEDYLWLYHVVH